MRWCASCDVCLSLLVAVSPAPLRDDGRNIDFVPLCVSSSPLRPPSLFLRRAVRLGLLTQVSCLLLYFHSTCQWGCAHVWPLMCVSAYAPPPAHASALPLPSPRTRVVMFHFCIFSRPLLSSSSSAVFCLRVLLFRVISFPARVCVFVCGSARSSTASRPQSGDSSFFPLSVFLRDRVALVVAIVLLVSSSLFCFFCSLSLRCACVSLSVCFRVRRCRCLVSRLPFSVIALSSVSTSLSRRCEANVSSSSCIHKQRDATSGLRRVQATWKNMSRKSSVCV